MHRPLLPVLRSARPSSSGTHTTKDASGGCWMRRWPVCRCRCRRLRWMQLNSLAAGTWWSLTDNLHLLTDDGLMLRCKRCHAACGRHSVDFASFKLQRCDASQASERRALGGGHPRTSSSGGPTSSSLTTMLRATASAGSASGPLREAPGCSGAPAASVAVGAAAAGTVDTDTGDEAPGPLATEPPGRLREDAVEDGPVGPTGPGSVASAATARPSDTSGICLAGPFSVPM